MFGPAFFGTSYYGAAYYPPGGELPEAVVQPSGDVYYPFPVPVPEAVITGKIRGDVPGIFGYVDGTVLDPLTGRISGELGWLAGKALGEVVPPISASIDQVIALHSGIAGKITPPTEIQVHGVVPFSVRADVGITPPVKAKARGTFGGISGRTEGTIWHEVHAQINAPLHGLFGGVRVETIPPVQMTINARAEFSGQITGSADPFSNEELVALAELL